MKIILTNGVELAPIMVTGASKYVQGANRDSLTFVFANTSLDEIDCVFTAENCENINIIGDDNSEAIHSGYTVRAELVKKLVETQKATTDAEAVTEYRVFVTMAQRTYAETKLTTLTIENVDTQLAIAELAEIVMGGM